MASVTIRSVHKRFGDAAVLHGVDIEIPDGSFTVLVGPSGCGKSTLLRMIAGLENISAGEISIGGAVVNKVPPKERDIAMVFQNYALYPHMTVRDNMAFSLSLAKADKASIDQRVGKAAGDPRPDRSCSTASRASSRAGSASASRWAARSCATRSVFLFDEPLSNLDAKLRVAMRTEIKELHQRLKTTSIYVTHDQIEAMTMADQIVVMHDGRIEQIGSPLQLYDHPANRFVAGFIGSPAMNFIAGTLRGDGAGPYVEGAGGARLPVDRVPADSDGRDVVYGIRPEHLDIADGSEGFEAEVVVVEPTGSETQVFARLGTQELIGVFRERHEFEPGRKIRLRPRREVAHLFDPASGQRI